MAFEVKYLDILEMINCSIGICAYNEEQNIGKALQVLQNQKLEKVEIAQIVVVASGCTDRTEDIVLEYAAADDRIKLIHQDQRQGKSSAVNECIKNATSDVVVLLSADTQPQSDAIEQLVLPFQDAKIGMTGGRPVPVNNPETFIGFCVTYMWELHHYIALQHPKCGEMIAFRRIFNSIPPTSAVDEAAIETIIREKELQMQYVPEAVVKNKGPENISDFIKQRRRIYSGHLVLIKKEEYQVSTLGGGNVLATIRQHLPSGLTKKIWIIGMIGLEVFSRFLGWWDISVRKKEPTVWKISESTKKVN